MMAAAPCANTLAAVRLRAMHKCKGTVNAMASVATPICAPSSPICQLKMGYRCVSVDQLARLTDLSRYVAELANLTHDDHPPYVGTSAFCPQGRHPRGGHGSNADSYQHIDPTGRRQSSPFGLCRNYPVVGNLVDKIEQYNSESGKPRFQGSQTRSNSWCTRFYLEGAGGLSGIDAMTHPSRLRSL